HTRCYRDWSSDVCSSDLQPRSRSERAKTRLPIAVRLSLALNVNAAVGADVVPLGPLEISQTGGVLSTMTRRVATARFPERSTAVAVSVWAPSPTLVVDHGAVAVTAAAGGGGTEFATSACVSAVNATLEMPLPLSVACACIVTV